MNGTFRVLLVLAAALSLAVAVYHLSRRAAARRNDLTALGDTLRCHTVARASAIDHRWHDCNLYAGHADVLHYCRCGEYWHTPAYVAHQIAQLHQMLGAQAYEPDRRHR